MNVNGEDGGRRLEVWNVKCKFKTFIKQKANEIS
jgi:hypothetical protein